MAVKPLNIHVTYLTQTFICISTKNEFLSKVCEKYNLNHEEIEIFEPKKKRYIDVDELQDLSKVEIRKKVSHAVNGRNHLPGPSTPRHPDDKEVTRKLLDNRALTGRERAYIIEMLERKEDRPKRKTNDDFDRPVMKHRKVQVDAANLNISRTVYTQTDKLIDYKPPLDSSLTNNALQIQSKKMASLDKIDPAMANDIMFKTFDKRRNFILLERPLAAFIKERYPLLFTTTGVRSELDRIFYEGKCEEFIANIEKYSVHILSIAREDDPLLITTQRKMEAFKTEAQKKYAQDVGALLMISSVVLEDRHFLKLKDKVHKTTDFPYISSEAKLHDLFFDQHIFRIHVEGNLLCEASDFKEAILCLIASYFIFNIRYQDSNFSTLVTFEKLFLEGNDTDETEIDDAVRQIIRSVQLKWKARSGS